MVLRLPQASAHHRHRTGASERVAEETLVRPPYHCQQLAAPLETEASSKTIGVFEAWMHLIPLRTASPNPRALYRDSEFVEIALQCVAVDGAHARWTSRNESPDIRSRRAKM